MRIRMALLAGTALIASMGGALAQERAPMVRGLYVGGAVGASWLYETNQPIHPMIATDLATPSDHFRQRWNVGPMGVLNAGWGFGNGLRLELEAFYRAYDEGGGSLLYSRPSSGGRATSWGMLVNGLWDFRVASWVVPYLGIGVGFAQNRWSGVSGTVVEGGLGGYGLRISDTQLSFAYQGIAGLSFPIAAVPGLAVGLEYRYVGTPQPAFNATQTSPRASQPYAVDPATHSNNLLFTVRYNFGQSRPATVVPVDPAPARSFIVFFDFNRSDLTARAREIVGQAAAAARRQQVTRIEVAGHTDTVGSAQYNQGLSQRRANTVAAELVRLGVPRESISTAGYGFSRPLVATGPNVREPQNRRVEIVFR